MARQRQGAVVGGREYIEALDFGIRTHDLYRDDLCRAQYNRRMTGVARGFQGGGSGGAPRLGAWAAYAAGRSGCAAGDGCIRHSRANKRHG
jgi:hypothetical protein